MTPDTEKPVAVSSHKLPGAFELFTPSINMIKNNLTAFMVLVGVPFVLMLIGMGPGLFSATPSSAGLTNSTGVVGMIGLIGYIAAILFAPGITLLQLKGAQKEHLTYEVAFKKGLTYFWRILGLGILIALILFVSILLFIVPFFLVLPRIILAPYYLVDRNLGVIEALKASAAGSKGNWSAIYGIVGVSVLIGLIGIVPILGTLASVVVSVLYINAPALRYFHLKSQAEGKNPLTPIELDVHTA